MTNVVVLSSIAALRAYSGGSASPAIWIEGYTSAGDGGEGMFTYVASDTTTHDNNGTVIIDGASHRYYREQKRGPFNILWFGGYADGTNDNTSALNSALAALPGGGGEIFFPPGRFRFASNISYTVPSGEFSLSIIGSGADVSTLYWPTTSGIEISASNPQHTVHFRDLTLTTGATNAIGVFLINSVPGGNFSQSDFFRVNFKGDNIATEFWEFGISIDGFSNIVYDTVLSFNSLIGVSLSGNTSAAPYGSIVQNFTNCGFFGGGVGILYGSYVQGVTVSQCNFTNGTTGISIPANTTGAEQLAVTGSQFNCTGNQIEISSFIGGVLVTGNLFYVDANMNGILVASPGGGLFQSSIANNNINGISATGSTGVNVQGGSTGVVVTSNVFNVLNVGVNLAQAANWNVQANKYVSVTTNVQNIGTANSVGVATQ